MYLTVLQAFFLCPLSHRPRLLRVLLHLHLHLHLHLLRVRRVVLSPLHLRLYGGKPANEAAVQTTTYDQTTAAASRSVTQQILYTSTFPNGGVTTVTSLTVVPAEQAQTAGGTSTNTANASLQTNSAKSVKAFSINGVLAALGLILVFGA